MVILTPEISTRKHTSLVNVSASSWRLRSTFWCNFVTASQSGSQLRTQIELKLYNISSWTIWLVILFDWGRGVTSGVARRMIEMWHSGVCFLCFYVFILCFSSLERNEGRLSCGSEASDGLMIRLDGVPRLVDHGDEPEEVTSSLGVGSREWEDSEDWAE